MLCATHAFELRIGTDFTLINVLLAILVDAFVKVQEKNTSETVSLLARNAGMPVCGYPSPRLAEQLRI